MAAKKRSTQETISTEERAARAPTAPAEAIHPGAYLNPIIYNHEDGSLSVCQTAESAADVLAFLIEYDCRVADSEETIEILHGRYIIEKTLHGALMAIAAAKEAIHA